MIFTTVSDWRWPRLRFEFLRRRFLKTMTLSPRVCPTISPATVAPATSGAAEGGLGAIAAADQHDLVEGDGVAGLAVELLDGDGVGGRDPILLPAGLDDCEHCLVQMSGPGLAVGGRERPGFHRNEKARTQRPHPIRAGL